jgi:hypothetical protein
MLLACVKVHIGNSDFVFGLSYVALSRATKISGLMLLNFLRPNRVAKKQKAAEAMLAGARRRRETFVLKHVEPMQHN